VAEQDGEGSLVPVDESLPAARPGGMLVVPSRFGLITVANLVVLALLPCMGWVNWFVAPLAVGLAGIGVVGLLRDRDPATGQVDRPGPYLAAITGGAALGVVSLLRLFLGFGIF
jgi:hypothetical protein